MSVVEEKRKSDSEVDQAPSVSKLSAHTGGVPLPDSGVIGEQLREILTLSTAFERHLGRTLSVNDTDLAAMEYLISHGPLTPSELARHLTISTAATTIVIDRLVAVGHAHREAHAHDRRKIVVVPTPASVRATFEALMPLIGGVASVTSELPADARATVADFLASIVGVYRRALEPPPV
jgi:DNA-binding MarR family transcriptional regulator